MKLQIDTFKKLITIEEQTNLSELFEAIQRLLPDTWKEWNIQSAQIINLSQPIIIKKYPIWPTYPTYPTQPYPWITYQGVYNVEY